MKLTLKIFIFSFFCFIKANEQLNLEAILSNLKNHNGIEHNFDINLLKRQAKRKWTILLYAAADNDLHYFAWNNIKQLATGANENVYIIVQLHEPGKNKKTQRYLIEKNKALLLNKENQQKLDSGDPKTLIDFCIWSIKHFPADNYMLDLSNHGSGVIDRGLARLINPSELFVLNPSNLMLELDRSIEFLEYLELRQYKNWLHKTGDCRCPKNKNGKCIILENQFQDPRGVCFDETYQSYLTNQKLDYALNVTCKEISSFLNEKDFKFHIFGMDACLMQMIEIANIAKKYAKILVASTEVELGPGWEYVKILKPLEEHNLDPKAFAKHIVKSYEETYSGITNEYTLSALNLDVMDKLEKNVNQIAATLIEILQNQKDNSAKNVIKKCKSNIAFEEPSYVDLASLYINLNNNMNKFTMKNADSEKLKNTLQTLIEEGLKIISETIIENVAGNNVSYSKGLSIYFPEKRIHTSYHKTEFAQTNQWINFLLHYVAL